MVVHAHSIELSGADGVPPTEFRLFKFGENETTKGKFVLDASGVADLLAERAKRAVDVAVDYEHQTYQSASNGQPAPAAGWIDIEARADGLWAKNARWTPRATKMFRDGEYKYFSPTFKVDAKGRIVRLMVPALTNDPASHGIDALIAASDSALNAPEPVAEKTIGTTPNPPRETNMNLTIIGLKDDAPEGEVQDRLVALTQVEREMHDMLSISGKATIAEAMAVMLAAKDVAVKLSAAETENAQWAARYAADQAVTDARSEAALFDAAFRSGRVGRENEELISKLKTIRASQGLEGLKLAIDLLDAKPVTLRQAPLPVNTADAQHNAVIEYQRSHPGVSYGDAVVKLAAERPALFSQEVR